MTRPHLDGLIRLRERIRMASVMACGGIPNAEAAGWSDELREIIQALAALPGGGVDGWVSVKDSLPDEGAEVLVYITDRGDGARFDFDFIEEGGWVAHNERRDHFLAVGGSAAAGPDVACAGPSEDAPYTHWKPLRAPSLPTPNPHEADRNERND